MYKSLTNKDYLLLITYFDIRTIELSKGTPFRHVEASTSSEDSFFVELNRLLNWESHFSVSEISTIWVLMLIPFLNL